MSQDFSEIEAYSYEASADMEDWLAQGSVRASSRTVHDAPRKTFQLIRPPEIPAWVADQERINVRSQFRALSTQIDRRFAGGGLLTQRLFSEEYAQVIGLGPKVVPILLKELEQSTSPWFWALKAITRVDPAKDVNQGDFASIAACWVQWGREQKLL